MFHPVPTPFAGSLPDQRALPYGLPRRIERLFAALALAASGLVCVGFWLGGAHFGCLDLLKPAMITLLMIAMAGMWVVEQAAEAPLSATAACWAAIQERVRSGSTQFAVTRPQDETPIQVLASLVADIVLQCQRVQAGRARDQAASESINLKLQAGRDEARRLAIFLRSDGASLADAASGIMVASARLADDTASTLTSADATERDVTGAINGAASLAAATRATTVEIARMSTLAVSASESAFATQRSVAALDGRSEALACAADQIGRALQLAAACGQAASVAAARSGEDGRITADITADLQRMAAAAEQTLFAMQLTIGELRAETGNASRRVAELSELIHAQHQLGDALGHAVERQGEEITRVLNHLSGAHAGIVTLRAGVDAVTRSGTSRLAGAEALRGAADRLPGHADTIASILRNIPDFAPPLDF